MGNVQHPWFQKLPAYFDLFQSQVWEFSESWFTMINISPYPCPNHPNLIQFPTCMKALYRQLYSNPRKDVQESKSSIFPKKCIPFGNQAWLGNPRTKWAPGKLSNQFWAIGGFLSEPWHAMTSPHAGGLEWLGVLRWAGNSFNCLSTGEVCTVPGLVESRDLAAETEGQL